MRTKLHITNAPAKTSVPANFYQQVLLGARRFGRAMCFSTHVVSQRAAKKNVIPSTDLQHGNRDLWKIFLDRPLLPVLVVIRMRQPIEIIGRDCSRELCISGELSKIKYRIIFQWERGHSYARIGVLFGQTRKRVPCQLRCPVLIEPLLECAALIGPAVVVIARCDIRRDSRQVRRLRYRRLHLGGAYVRGANHPDFAIRIR